MKKNTVKSENRLLWDAYVEVCRWKAFQENPYQEKILPYFQNLYDELESPRFFSFLFKKDSLKSLYIWGEVGRGKTFLMDLFFDQMKHTLKRRIHFHGFMREVHARLHRMNENNEGGLSELIKQIAREAKLLCLDEFQVTNIADAMILTRLFEGLFQEEVVIVVTSNTEPQYLYEKGLHRERFLPFISLLQKNAHIFHLQGAMDYRQVTFSEQKRYFIPCNEATKSRLRALWDKFTENTSLGEILFEREGTSLILEGLAKGVAWAHFDDLCARPCGTREYLALVETIHTLILWGIPKMTSENHNEAVRFTTLIDILYDKGIKLVAAAEALPEHLYQQGGAFDRTVSRLYEMQHG